ncbi:hypothetical protein DIURU_004759 [Diutina rugosa]|uniref:Uncharacterized protein n=1 Tax=Diutina rugosa TaxID=5481 RepID=A0A642UJA1_DIURU|nr:uncharacterized protein DIURU_004759 [Diutina rugosa]KAA8897906.1 hypothetical protein DIURU_004759 [Diutina rugosa]
MQFKTVAIALTAVTVASAAANGTNATTNGTNGTGDKESNAIGSAANVVAVAAAAGIAMLFSVPSRKPSGAKVGLRTCPPRHPKGLNVDAEPWNIYW